MYQRVKTLHPTINNITDGQVPIPIESSFFLEDGQQDKDKFNRYYFNFPPEWCTANRGESIIGVRNMWLISKRRKLEFTITNEDDEFGIALKLKKTNQDFDEVFNIGDGPHQNKKYVYLNQFDDVLTFDNVWDRHSCKVYSSIAEQSFT